MCWQCLGIPFDNRALICHYQQNLTHSNAECKGGNNLFCSIDIDIDLFSYTVYRFLLVFSLAVSGCPNIGTYLEFISMLRSTSDLKWTKHMLYSMLVERLEEYGTIYSGKESEGSWVLFCVGEDKSQLDLIITVNHSTGSLCDHTERFRLIIWYSCLTLCSIVRRVLCLMSEFGVQQSIIVCDWM